MMSRTQFEQALRPRLDRKPFQPFTIEFDDGTRWTVAEKGAVSYLTGDSAMIRHADGSFDLVDADNVKQFLDLVPTTAP